MRTWYAKNLREYMDLVHCISDKQKDQERKYPLWFRGHEQTGTYYYLEPNIYRNFSNGKEENRCNRNRTYGTLWLKEEYRYQHFMARNYDKVTSVPESMIEWQELMQHYFAKTRLMDWSESAVVALNFALEAFMNPMKDDHEVEYKRRNNAPVVWALNPVKLNRKVYQCFRNNKDLVDRALSHIALKNRRAIINELQKNESLYFSLDNLSDDGVNGLISLSGLEALRHSYGANLDKALKSLNFNPFFYLLLKYYSDGMGVETLDLPPLAIIHPYHSARIHEQKGAFTIFPYYTNGMMGPLSKIKISPYAMEYMMNCQDCLEKIVITDAMSLAEQLKEAGGRRSHIYPEMEIVTKDFENTEYR